MKTGKVEEPIELNRNSSVSFGVSSLNLPTNGEESDDISSIDTDYQQSIRAARLRQQGFEDDQAIPASQEFDSYEISSIDYANHTSMQSDRSTRPYPKSNNYNTDPSKESLTSDTDDSTNNSEEGGLLPLWISDAPAWIKTIILVSVTLLIGSIILVGVGASLAVKYRTEKVDTQPAPSASTYWQGPDAGPPNAGPPDTGSPPSESTTKPTFSPTASPVVSTTSEPTAMTDWNPNYNPETTVQFFVTGGRFTGDSLSHLPDQLSSLPGLNGTSLLFHLGDWNSPISTACDEESYQDIVNLYKESNIPVQFVVGDNEFNDCPDPQQAYDFWHEYLVDFESTFWTGPSLERQENFPENFAFLDKGVLMIGINLVGGVVHDDQEWEDRHDADLVWIDSKYLEYKGQFETMVVFAHADPEIQVNELFFDAFYDMVKNDYKQTQVVYIHRNMVTESWGLENKYNNVKNLVVVTVEGSTWPPLMVSINTDKGTIDVDQEEWYESYSSPGPL